VICTAAALKISMHVCGQQLLGLSKVRLVLSLLMLLGSCSLLEHCCCGPQHNRAGLTFARMYMCTAELG
jgi:hypothetical protein